MHERVKEILKGSLVLFDEGVQKRLLELVEAANGSMKPIGFQTEGDLRQNIGIFLKDNGFTRDEREENYHTSNLRSLCMRKGDYRVMMYSGSFFGVFTEVEAARRPAKDEIAQAPTPATRYVDMDEYDDDDDDDEDYYDEDY